MTPSYHIFYTDVGQKSSQCFRVTKERRLSWMETKEFRFAQDRSSAFKTVPSFSSPIVSPNSWFRCQSSSRRNVSQKSQVISFQIPFVWYELRHCKYPCHSRGSVCFPGMNTGLPELDLVERPGLKEASRPGLNRRLWWLLQGLLSKGVGSNDQQSDLAQCFWGFPACSVGNVIWLVEDGNWP